MNTKKSISKAEYNVVKTWIFTEFDLFKPLCMSPVLVCCEVVKPLIYLGEYCEFMFLYTFINSLKGN